MQVVLASHNAKKLQELRRILAPQLETAGIELIGYNGPEPIENGASYEENALLKARAAADYTGLPAIADDSGISVEILGGSPGIFSARWAGSAKSDTNNVNLLLEQLADVPTKNRGAAFICVAALVTPEGAELSERGIWQGELLFAPSGSGGFGYDPIFKPEGSVLSAAEMSAREKDAVSHRTRAFMAIAPKIVALKH